MNADKNGIQMSNAVHQYALFGNALFKLNKTVVHASDPRKQIVICSNGPDIRYATLEEWDKPANLSTNMHRPRASLPARAQRATNSSSFAIYFPVAKMCTLTGIAEKTGASAIHPPAQMSGGQAFVPKQTIRELNALNVAAAHSLS